MILGTGSIGSAAGATIAGKRDRSATRSSRYADGRCGLGHDVIGAASGQGTIEVTRALLAECDRITYPVIILDGDRDAGADREIAVVLQAELGSSWLKPDASIRTR